MKKSTSACLPPEVGNVSQHRTSVWEVYNTDSNHLIVTVAVLTVIALGAAVVPMCKFEILLS